MNILVTGGSGFIGHHLVNRLVDDGHWVCGVDIQPPQFGETRASFDNWSLDLREYATLDRFIRDLASSGLTFDRVYALAANMGGIGFISSNDYEIARDNSYINLNTAEIVRRAKIPRLLFSSSACVYPDFLQQMPSVYPEPLASFSLGEGDAWRGVPGTSYGIEKLMAEEMYQALGHDHGTEIRIARFHNIYGPEGSWDDGREKLPAAACRKIARWDIHERDTLPEPIPIEVWGTGQQVRSFCYISDCLEMLVGLMESDCSDPMNIGTDRGVTVDQVFDTVADIAGLPIEKEHDLSKPQGVLRRNADLSLMREVLAYEPRVSLEEGLQQTYRWVRGQALEKWNGS